MTNNKGLLEALMTNNKQASVLHHAMMTDYPFRNIQIIGTHLE